LNIVISQGPDWAQQLIAWSTLALALATIILAFGIGIAAMQFWWQRRANRVVETGRLLERWDDEDLAEFCNDLDELDGVEENRCATIEKYLRSRGSKEDESTFDFPLESMARMAERFEIYIRKGVADESIVIEHIGYNVLAAYYHLHDILQARATAHNLEYEGFRDLALRIQDYARIHPEETGFPPDLDAVIIPIIEYRDGSESRGYLPNFFQRAQIVLAKKKVRAPGSVAKDIPVELRKRLGLKAEKD
jgi:hypothetical protein